MALTIEDVDRQIGAAFAAFEANVEQAIITGITEYSARPASFSHLPLSPVTVVSSDPTIGTTVTFDTDPALMEVPVQTILGATAGQRGLVMHTADGGGYLLPFDGILGAGGGPADTGAFLLSGRTGGQAAFGGVGPGENMTLTPNPSSGQGGYIGVFGDATHEAFRVQSFANGQLSLTTDVAFQHGRLSFPYASYPTTDGGLAVSEWQIKGPNHIQIWTERDDRVTTAGSWRNVGTATGQFQDGDTTITIPGGGLSQADVGRLLVTASATLTDGTTNIPNLGAHKVNAYIKAVSADGTVATLVTPARASAPFPPWTEINCQYQVVDTAAGSPLHICVNEYLASPPGTDFTNWSYRGAFFLSQNQGPRGLIQIDGTSVFADNNAAFGLPIPIQTGQVFTNASGCTVMGLGAIGVTVSNQIQGQNGLAIRANAAGADFVDNFTFSGVNGSNNVTWSGFENQVGFFSQTAWTNHTVFAAQVSKVDLGSVLGTFRAMHVYNGERDWKKNPNDGQTTAGSTTITTSAPFFDTTYDVNAPIQGIVGFGAVQCFPPGTTITAVASTTQATVSHAAISTQTAVGFTVFVSTNVGPCRLDAVIGLDVDLLNSGDVLNIGVRNASATVYSPRPQFVDATTSIMPNTSLLSLQTGSGATVTLPNPNITTVNAQAGQKVEIVNGGPGNVVFTNGQGVYLGTSTLTMAPGERHSFIYVGAGSLPGFLGVLWILDSLGGNGLRGSVANVTTNLTTIDSTAVGGPGVLQLATTYTQDTLASGLSGTALVTNVNQEVTFRTLANSTISPGGSTTSVLTCATGNFTTADVGVGISGTGVPAFTTITSVNSPTSVNVSSAFTFTAGSGLSLKLTFITPQGGYAAPWFDGTHGYPSIMQGPYGHITTQGVTQFDVSGVDMPVIFQSFEVFKNQPGTPISFATSAMFNLSPQIVADGAACKFAANLGSNLPPPDAAHGGVAPDWQLGPYGQILQGGFCDDPWYGTINGGSLHNNAASGNDLLASVGFWSLPVFYGDVTMATRVDFLANEVQAWTDAATSGTVHTPALDRHVGFMAQRSTFAVHNLSAVFNNSVEFLDVDRTFTRAPFLDAGFTGIIGFGGAAISMSHNYTLNFANATTGAFVQTANTWAYKQSMSAIGHGAFAQDLSTIKNATRAITAAAIATSGGTTAVLTAASGAFTAGDVGASVIGTGVPAGTLITSLVSGTSVNVSAPTNFTAGSGLSLTVAANVTFTSIYGFLAQTTIQADRVPLQAGTLTTFQSSPTFTRTNGGTFSGNALIGFQSGGAVAAGATLFSRVGFRVTDASGTGVVSSQIGILIDNLTFGGTNIGLLNNSTTVYALQNQTVAAGGAVAPTATGIGLSSAADVTLGNPNITAAVANGQILRIVNVGSHNITFTNGFGIFLPAGTLVLAPGNTVSFIYTPTLAGWVADGAGSTTASNVLRLDGTFSTVTAGGFGNYGATAFVLPNALTLRFAQGTSSAPTRVLNGNLLGGLLVQGWNDIDGAYNSAAYLSVSATGDFHAAGNAPANLLVQLNGGSGLTTVATFSTAGMTALSMLASSATGGIGYTTGAGGTVTQVTSKSAGVALNKVCGQITMNGAALAASTSVGFTLTNTAIAATDGVAVWVASGATASSYVLTVDAVSPGSCHIHLRNVTALPLSQSLILGFAVIKAVAA